MSFRSATTADSAQMGVSDMLVELSARTRRVGNLFLPGRLSLLWSALLSFPLAGLCAGTPGQYLFQTWDTSSGLPHNTVRSIAQTPDGYLWIGTENGLARFDGVRFENFVRENTPALQNPNVEFLQTDASGTLWVGANGQVAAWDGRRLTAQERPLAAGDQTDRLLISRTNEVFFSTVQGCLIRGRLRSPGDWQWTSSLPAGPCMFAVDAGGEIWRLTLGGKLWRMTGQQPERIQISEAAGLINQMTADVAGLHLAASFSYTDTHGFYKISDPTIHEYS